MTAVLARALAPLDALRAVLLGLFAPLGRRLFAERSRRVAVYAAVGLACAIATTCAAPLWAFALGPIVLGVPHLLADVRYLVARPGLHRRRALALATAVPLVLYLATQSTAVGLSAALFAILFSSASRARKAVALAIGAAVVAAAAAFPFTSSLVLVHGHNFVAVALFLFVFARARRVGIAVAAAFAAIAIAILAGGFDAALLRPFAVSSKPATALGLDTIVAMIAPVGDPVLGARIVFLFVFAQAVHYVIWLRLVPEEARERPGVRSFTSSLRALDRDVGGVVLAIFLLLAIAIAARALFSVEAARFTYLTVAGFHAHLELAFGALFLMEGRKLVAS